MDALEQLRGAIPDLQAVLRGGALPEARRGGVAAVALKVGPVAPTLEVPALGV